MYLIPHICHLYHLYIGGGKSVMWRNFIFPDLEKTAVSPRVDKLKKNSTWQRSRNLKSLHMCVEDVSKYVKFMLFCYKISLSRFTLFCCKICFFAIHALLCGDKSKEKFHRWRRNYKYEVWCIYYVLLIYYVGNFHAGKIPDK